MNTSSPQPVIHRFAPPHAEGGYDEVQNWPGGNVCYLLNGVFHRLDGPAFVGADGSTIWLREGKEHREDGPAVENPADGVLEYWIDGIHLDGPPDEAK